MGDLLNETYTFKRTHTFPEVVRAIKDYSWGMIVRSETLADGRYVMKFFTPAILGDGIEGVERYTTGYQIIYSMKGNKLLISMEYAFNFSHSRLNHAKRMMAYVFEMLDAFDGALAETDENVIDAEVTEVKEATPSAAKLMEAKKLLDAGAITDAEYNEIKNHYMKQFR